MALSLEHPSAASHIAYVDFSQRKKFIKENKKDFSFLPERYSGTEKQNIALLNFLKKNPEMRKKWEKELIKKEQ